MHPGLVRFINQSLGSFDWMANVGGAMHGHPSGTKAGGLAMIQSINGHYQENEYLQAIQKWGNRDFNPDLAYRYF
jgi:ribulose 1,5-bisphosphate carboxylase large subunit-like protein